MPVVIVFPFIIWDLRGLLSGNRWEQVWWATKRAVLIYAVPASWLYFPQPTCHRNSVASAWPPLTIILIPLPTPYVFSYLWCVPRRIHPIYYIRFLPEEDQYIFFSSVTSHQPCSVHLFHHTSHVVLNALPSMCCCAMIYLLCMLVLRVSSGTSVFWSYFWLIAEPSPLHTTTIVEKCTLKLVDEYKHMLCQANEPLSTFLQYIT